MADPDLLARLTASPFAFRDAPRLACLDRIVLLLAVLVCIELLDLLDPDVSALALALLLAAVLGFVLLWGRSVVGLAFGDGV